LNFTPGFACGLLLGWDVVAAVLLGGATWVTSSGVASKLMNDFGWTANRETPAVLNLLVIEDLAMAVYLPIVGALVAGRAFGETAITVAVALGGVVVILAVALRFGRQDVHIVVLRLGWNPKDTTPLIETLFHRRLPGDTDEDARPSEPPRRPRAPRPSVEPPVTPLPNPTFDATAPDAAPAVEQPPVP